ncbi:MAG: GC-type dockerin domain-anchored protein [Phycisphaerales bacterium JB040]
MPVQSISRVRPIGVRRSLALVVSMCLAVVCVPTAQAQSRSAGLGIDTAQEYDAFLDAIRASEYVRQGFILDGGAPRQIAVIAGLAAFADRNPLATPEQFAAFAQSYDALLGLVVPGDPDLRRAGSLMIGLSAARVDAGGVLDGTDTRVASRAIELLGRRLPGLDGLEQAERRMTRFDRTTVARLANSSAFAEVLITNLLGVDGEGTAREGLSEATAAYLEGEGYTPMLGQIDPAQVEVNAGLAAMPDFAGYQALLADPDPSAVTGDVLADIESVRLETQGTLGAINATALSDTLMQDTAATRDAALGGDQGALDELAAVEAEVRARAVAVAEQRARTFANTLLLMQSEYPDIRYSAERARDFASIQLQVNNDMAKLKAGLDTAGSVVGLAAAIYTGDAWGATQSAFDLVGNAIGLGEEFGLIEGDPSVDEQVFDQVVQLRQQVEELRVEMNERFDLVDQKLDTIFDTMIAGFGQLGDQIGELQESVDDIALSIFELRSELSRLEESLFLLAEAEFLDLLNVNAELALDYRNDTGQDLPYSQSATNFVDAGIDFLSFATFTSENAPFIDPGVVITLDNADEELGAGAVGRAFGALNTVPAGLTLADGTPYTRPPFVLADLAAPAAWSQPAAMYAQLARENPWYFAYQYGNQRASNPGDTNLDRIVRNGETIRNFALNARDPLLFEALIERARDGADEAQAAVDEIVYDEVAPLGLNSAGEPVDPWGGLKQGDFSANLPKLGPITDMQLWSYTVPSSVSRNGYGFIAGNNLDVAVDVENRSELIDRVTMARLLDSRPGDNFFTAVTFQGGSSSIFTLNIITALDRGNSIRWVVKRQLELQVRTQTTFSPERVSQSQIRTIIRDLLTNDDFFADLDDGRISSFHQTTIFIPFTFLIVGPYISSSGSIPDITYAGNVDPGDTGEDIDNDILPVLASLREDAAVAVSNAAASRSSPEFESAVDRLHDAEALLDAYGTIALDDALTRSEILRSALRGFSSVGFRRENLLRIVFDLESAYGAGTEDELAYDVPTIGGELHRRLDILKSELDAALAQGGPTFPYIEFVLAELERLELEAFDLATDDTYVTDGALSVNSNEGLIANDVLQPGRTVEVDLAFLAGPDAVAPQHGTVQVNADGSFVYTPGPGFTGVDRFNYRLTARVDDSANPVGDPNAYSDPADVVIRVGAIGCLADTNGDGVLDLGDINTFVALYLAADPAADTNGDGVLDLGDINTFVQAFLSGC